MSNIVLLNDIHPNLKIEVCRVSISFADAGLRFYYVEGIIMLLGAPTYAVGTRYQELVMEYPVNQRIDTLL